MIITMQLSSINLNVKFTRRHGLHLSGHRTCNAQIGQASTHQSARKCDKLE